MPKKKHSYYIVYDTDKVYWFTPKSAIDERNLNAIAKKKHFSKDLLVKEFLFTQETLNKIKQYLISCHKKAILILNNQKEEPKDVELPNWSPFNN